MRPPKLNWEDSRANGYYVQSEQVRGEPRRYYAICVLAGRRWSGPSRRSESAAMIDAEYHAAGRLAERPACFAYSL